MSGITDPSDCIGFPNNAGATVVFTANTVAEVSVNGSYEFGTLSTGVNYVDVTFVGQGPDVSGLKGDFAGNGVKGATWTSVCIPPVFQRRTRSYRNAWQWA